MKPGEIVYQGKSKKGREFYFRYPTKDDAQIMCDYLNKLSKERTFITWQGQEMTLEKEEEYLKGLLEKILNNKTVALLVFSKNKLIGFSDVSLHERVESHVGNFGITIDKDYRGEGIGRMLMEKVVEEAIKNLNGLKIITLGVFANNPNAQDLYKKFGFTEFGNLPEGVKHKDQFVDHLFMYKKIK